MANYNPHSAGSDEYLTPPDLIKALGPFALDPCVAAKMPWKTARVMYNEQQDGLRRAWRQRRVFMNPPYSDVGPWADRFVANANGIALVSAKSTDTAWCQKLMRAADSCLWLAGRISFYRADGKQTAGKWLPNLLIAATGADSEALVRLIRTTKYKGLIFKGLHQLEPDLFGPPDLPNCPCVMQPTFGGDDDI